MKKSTKIIYYVFTGLYTLGMVPSILMYFFNTAEVSKTFVKLGFPAGLIIPLGIAKLLGVIAIWGIKSRVIKELAYAGFAVDLCLASISHVLAKDELSFAITPLVFLVILIVSFVYHRKLFVAK